MTTEKELIGKIRELRQIKPSQDWVSFNKTRILGEEPRGFTLFPYFKPAFAVLTVFSILFGVFGYDLVKHSLPGDLLYAIRRVYHESRVVFISEEEKPAFQLKLANDRLEDLAKTPPAKNLAPTILEFQANISEAAKNLAKIEATSSDAVIIRKIVEEAKKIEENKQKVEFLGVNIGEKETDELESALGKIVENLIKDLESRTLEEGKEIVLNKIKELSGEKKYSEALEFYLINQ